MEPSPRIFAITTSFNEDFFLPRWVRYYGSQLGYEHLYIVDHGSSDLSTLNLGAANVVKIPRGPFSDVRKALFSSDLHAALLQYYDGGLVTDVDEFLVADPRRHKSLKAFLAAAPAQALCAIGLELLHIPSREGAFLPHLPILSQRRHLFFNSAICKHCFSRTRTTFGGGFHTSTNPVQFDEDFYLFHLKNFDYDWRQFRQKITRGWDYESNFGTHARWSDQEAKTFLDNLIANYGSDVRDGFDFKADCAKLIASVRRYGDGRYGNEEDFFGDGSRLAPREFSVLF